MCFGGSGQRLSSVLVVVDGESVFFFGNGLSSVKTYIERFRKGSRLFSSRQNEKRRKAAQLELSCPFFVPLAVMLK